MGQGDVLEFLKEKRNNKNNNWFSLSEIKENLKQSGVSDKVLSKVHSWTYKLCAFDLLEVKGVGIWNHKKLFRYKK